MHNDINEIKTNDPKSHANIIPEELLSHFEEIAKRLWNNKASVIIGAGFSKNSDESFPDWKELGNIFRSKLN